MEGLRKQPVGKPDHPSVAKGRLEHFMGCRPTAVARRECRHPNATDNPGEGLRRCIKLVEAKVAKLGLFQNPGSNDELVRDLEDSGYPVDGSTSSLFGNRMVLLYAPSELVATPVQLDKNGAQRICATPSEDKSRSDGDVPKQGNAADSTIHKP